jgi:hypothetical protein
MTDKPAGIFEDTPANGHANDAPPMIFGLSYYFYSFNLKNRRASPALGVGIVE